MPNLTIGKLRGGYCVTWYDENGKRRRYQLKAQSKAQADSEAIDVFRKQTYTATLNNVSVAEIWASYIDDLGDKPTATTMKYTGKAVLPHFGEYKPDQITKPLCKAYSESRRAIGRAQGTVWTEMGHLQSALNFGHSIKMYSGDIPKIWRPAKPETDKRILNVGEIRSLVDAAQSPHIRLALLLLLGTGARVGAILDLTWDRVNFERGQINLRVDDSQTRKGRANVPMNATTRSALEQAYEAALSNYVVEYGGKRIKSIRNGFTNSVGHSGIGHVTIHELRHTAAVHMIGAGVPIEKVAQVLGHSNVSVTYTVYGRFLPEQMQDAVNVLDFMNLNRTRSVQ